MVIKGCVASESKSRTQLRKCRGEELGRGSPTRLFNRRTSKRIWEQACHLSGDNEKREFSILDRIQRCQKSSISIVRREANPEKRAKDRHSGH